MIIIEGLRRHIINFCVKMDISFFYYEPKLSF